MKQIFLRTLKVVLGVLLLIFLITRADISKVIGLMGSSNGQYLLFAFSVYVVTVVVVSLRWRMLLLAQGINIPLNRLISFYFVGLFVNNFLPTSIGGDIVRAVDTAAESRRKAESIASVLVERLVGLLGLVLLVLVASLFVLREVHNPHILVFDLAILTGLIAASLFFFNDRASSGFVNWSTGITFFDLGRRIRSLYDSIRIYRNSKKTLAGVFAVSILYQGMMMLFVYLVNVALGLGVPFVYFVLFVPVVAIISVIPISINALGVREGGYVYLLATIGRTTSEALSLSLMIYAIGVLVSLFGGILFVLRRERLPWGRAGSVDELAEEGERVSLAR